MGLFLGQLCTFVTSQKILENSIPFEQIFFNTPSIVSQKHKCISIVVLLVFNFKNASRLYGQPIYARYSFFFIENFYLASLKIVPKFLYFWPLTCPVVLYLEKKRLKSFIRKIPILSIK